MYCVHVYFSFSDDLDSVSDFERLQQLSFGVTKQAVGILYELCRYVFEDTKHLLNNVTLTDLLLRVCEKELSDDSAVLKIKMSKNATVQDICDSIIAFYKGRFVRESFVTVSIVEESVVDMGGVRRQVYSTLFEGIANGYLELFEGPLHRVVRV